MFTIPFTSTRLQFTPSFGFLPTFLQALALLVLLAASVALIVGLYRVELRRVSRRVASALLTLRIATIAIVFLIWTSSPTAIRTVREAQPDRVLVAVDLSDSLRVTDPDRPLVEKLRLARTLALHETIVPWERLDAWIADVERGAEPADPAMVEIIRRCDLVTRLQGVELALASDGASLLDKLKRTHAVELIGFHRAASDLPMEGALLQAAIAAKSPGSAFTDLSCH